MADVFISYAREDRPRAEQVARGLQAMGLEPFWDTEIPPGQTWADYIEGKLSQCPAVVVLWSEHSTKSQWVREEARMGRDKSKLIPALLDATPAPFGFGEVQAANLSSWGGEPNHPDWVRFSNAVHAAARGAGATPPPPRAQAAYTPPPPPYAQPSSSGAVEALSPIDYIKKCFRLFFDGKGRARRAEYWWWIAFTIGVSIIASIIDYAVGGGMNPYTNQLNSQIVSTIASLALLAPSASVMSRRFHDVGLNGWLVAAVYGGLFVGYALQAAAMGIGTLVLAVVVIAALVVLVLPGKPGSNQYGPNPKGI
jgi:uncharacterized membrane protein YhaH (DUF805 family)